MNSQSIKGSLTKNDGNKSSITNANGEILFSGNLGQSITTVLNLFAEDADAEINGALIEGVEFQSDLRLQEAYVDGVEFQNCTFTGCDFKDTQFWNTRFHNCVFNNCDFTGCLYDNNPIAILDLMNVWNCKF